MKDISTAKVSQKPFRVAIDDGLAQIKLFGEAPDGQFRSLKFATAIKPAGSGGLLDIGGSIINTYETEEGERFVCSDAVKAEEIRFPDFHVSPMNRVLIRHALLAAGYGGTQVELLTSLPVDEFFAGAARNQGHIDRKVENLGKGVIQVASTAPHPDLVNIKVGCQAISAFFDYIFDLNGHPTMEVPEALAIVDIGGSTTDIAVILEGEQIDPNSSGAARVGVLDVHTALREKLEQKFNAVLRLTPKIIDNACRTRKIHLWGETHDIDQLVTDAVREAGQTIMREIDRKIGNGATLDKILLVGGGAALFSEFLGHWRNTTILPDGEFANARGLLKFARTQG